MLVGKQACSKSSRQRLDSMEEGSFISLPFIDRKDWYPEHGRLCLQRKLPNEIISAFVPTRLQ